MSHASLIVAVSPEQVKEHGSVENAVAWNMEPFDENDEMFADGSRWDWYQIGGRFTGKLRPDYEPEKDPANIQVCNLCGGTGTRPDMLVANGCNGCQGTGKHVKWPTQWAKFNDDVMTVAQLKSTPEHEAIHAYAFLRDRCWYESARLGWLGMPAKTECEIKAEQRGEDYKGRCLHTDTATGAKVVSFEEDSDEGRWKELFWARFMRRLPDDATVVVVDYHV